MGIALEHDKKIDALTSRVSELEEKVKILAIAVITNGGIDIPEPEGRHNPCSNNFFENGLSEE